MASCANVVGTAFTEGTQPDVKNQRTTGGSAFYRVYDTSDGRQLVLGRPGDEVHPQSAGRARQARDGRRFANGPGRTRSR